MADQDDLRGLARKIHRAYDSDMPVLGHEHGEDLEDWVEEQIRSFLAHQDQALTAALAREAGLRGALESIWAGVGDALLSGTGISKGYAHSVQAEVSRALQDRPPLAREAAEVLAAADEVEGGGPDELERLCDAARHLRALRRGEGEEG